MGAKELESPASSLPQVFPSRMEFAVMPSAPLKTPSPPGTEGQTGQLTAQKHTGTGGQSHLLQSTVPGT